LAGSLVVDLERFWPSRRGHAFDELCRMTASTAR